MNQIMNSKPLTIFGDGTQTRAFSYIDDVAPYIACGVEIKDAYNQIFNIGADVPYTVKYLAEVISDAFGVKEKIQYLPARNEVVNAYSSHEKAKDILSAVPTTDLVNGIRRMASWALLTGPRKSKKFNNIEVIKNMPPSWLDN
jgi:UDP-glucose 4-epimerase